MRQLRPYTVYLIYSGVQALLRSLQFTVAAVYFVTVVGLNPFQLVLVGTTLMIVIMLSEVPTGIVADTYSRRLSVIIGAALIGAGFIVTAIPQFSAILVAQVIWGIGATFTSGALEAWIADELGGQNLDAVYLRGTQVGNIGALAGIAGSVALAGVQLSLPLVVSGVIGLALAAFLVFAMPEHGFRPQRRAGQSAWGSARQTLRTSTRLVRGRAALMTIMGITLFFGMQSESFDRLWEVHFLAISAFPASVALTPVAWFGIIRAATLLLSTVVTGVVGRWFDTRSHHGLARMLAGITALVLAGMVVFGLAETFGVALAAYLVVALMRRLYEPLYLAWLSQHSPSAVRATILSLAGQVDAVGQIAGGPLFGLLATALSTGAAIVVAGLVLAPALLLYRVALRHDAAPAEQEAGEFVGAEG